LAFAVAVAVHEVRLYPRVQVKRVTVVKPEPAPPLQSVASPDNAQDDAIAKPVKLEARATVKGTATAKLKTLTRAEMIRALGISPATFSSRVASGLYPDFDYYHGLKKMWFEETLHDILHQEKADNKPCVRCHITKPLFEFGLQPKCRDGRGNVCLECVRDTREERNAYGPAPSLMPSPTPYDAARVGHDKFETHRFLNRLRSKNGGVPCDAIRSGLVRRDQMVTP